MANVTVSFKKIRSQPASMALVIMAFGITGVAFLLATQAATSATAFEAENSDLSGDAAVVNSVAADGSSGSSYVSLHGNPAATPTPTPTATPTPADPRPSANPAAFSLKNGLLEVAFTKDIHLVDAGREFDISGLSSFKSVPHNENYAFALDAVGYGFALYDNAMPSSFTIAESDDSHVTVNVRRTTNINVEENYTLYRDVPALEIEYTRFDPLWFEDFYQNVAEPKAYTIYGVNEEIDAARQEALELQAETLAQAQYGEEENFGDMFLKALGVTAAQAKYKGYTIFGNYNTTTGRGIGFVIPVNNIHDCWKLWSIYNYECFPNIDGLNLPFKRYVFVVEGGKDGVLNRGKAIADQAAAGSPLTPLQ